MLRPNEIFDGTYQVVKEIGRGGAGVVYLAVHLRLQKYVVLKRIRTNYQDMQAVRVETDILKNLHHKSLPQIYDFIMRQGEVYTVMDFIDGSDLSQVGFGPGVISTQMAMQWFRQLMDVLEYMHTRQKPIIHSDIKPANIMLMKDGSICLIDFNISLEDSQQGMIMGYSEDYASPEQIAMAEAFKSRTPVKWKLDGRTDIYSAAASIYYLMTGLLPNATGNFPRLSEISGLPYPPGFMAIIDRCLETDRNRRYRTAGRVLRALDDIKKQDARYKRFLMLEAVSWLGSALLIGGGAALILNGNARQHDELFHKEYDTFYSAVSSGDEDAVIDKGLSMLNENRFRGIFGKRPGDKAGILHSMGDAYYAKGDFPGAAEEYSNAVDALPLKDVNRGDYYYDLGLALAACGRYDEAREAMDMAGSSVSDDTRMLLEAVIAYRSGDTAGCISVVQSILAKPGSNNVCAEACLTAANSCGTATPEGISWLETALVYGSRRDIVRTLAAGYQAISGQYTDRNTRRAYMQKAQEKYCELVAYNDASAEDWFGLAVTDYVLGDNDGCINILSAYTGSGSSDFRVWLYSALAYKAKADTANASYCTQQAAALAASMSESQRAAADQGMLQILSELQREYGL